jgi:hypothetical protein
MQLSQTGSVQQYTGEPFVDNIVNIVNPATAMDVSYEPPLDNLKINEILRIVRVVYGVSIRETRTGSAKARDSFKAYFDYNNCERRHQRLDRKTPY